MSNFGSDKFVNSGPTMSIEGVETAGITKIVTIYDDFDGYKESGSINFPSGTLNLEEFMMVLGEIIKYFNQYLYKL